MSRVLRLKNPGLVSWFTPLRENSSCCSLDPRSQSALPRMLLLYQRAARLSLLSLSSSLLSEGWEDLRRLKISFLISLGRQCQVLSLRTVFFLLPILQSLVLWKTPEGAYALSPRRWEEYSSGVHRGPSCSAQFLEYFHFYPQADFLYPPCLAATSL